MLDREKLQSPFSYSRLEFHEAYRTIEDPGNQGADPSGNSSHLTYLFFKSKKDREGGNGWPDLKIRQIIFEQEGLNVLLKK